MSMKTQFQNGEAMQNARINCLDSSARASMTLKCLGIEYIHQVQSLSPADLHQLIWPLTLQQQNELREALAIWIKLAQVQRS